MALPVLFGAAALAIDVGYMYVARGTMQNAADAGARAGASALAEGRGQDWTTAVARNFANQNITAASYLHGATPSVSYPTANSVRVTINHTLPLFFAPVVGFNTAGINAGATANFVPARSVDPYNVVPLGIYCNNPDGCDGRLAVEQILGNIRRHCGNFFGSSGAACTFSPSAPSDGETFLTGITFSDVADVSNSEFRDSVRDGYAGTVTLGQHTRALPGTRQGWASGMQDRLLDGRNEMTFVVIEPLDPNDGNYNVKVVEFVQVRINGFYPMSRENPDRFDVEVIRRAVSATDFADPNEGLGINSVVGVRLIQ